MSKKPFLNALGAFICIAIVASFMFYGPKQTGPVDSVIAPIVVLSLFTLSIVIMGSLFFYQPLQLYLSGKKKNAVNLFLQTVAVFAGITALLLAALFFVF